MQKRYKVTFGVLGAMPAEYQTDLFDDVPYYVTEIGAELYAMRTLHKYKARRDKRPWYASIWKIEPDGPDGAKATWIKGVDLETQPRKTKRH